MKQYDYFHEKETVVLEASEQISRKLLHVFLISLGFKSEDDFYYLDRRIKAMPWQSITIINIDVFLNEKEVYETEYDIQEGNASFWDKLEISYFLATLPDEYIDIFCEKIYLIANNFNLRIVYQEKEMNKEDILNIFKNYSKELSENYSEPGSKYLYLLIKDTYPR